ncbi:hypothetical protein M0804_004443 [Polistes exclamans]|nr:hypothetical protein M0804_004443 [Polistes exclamans]
MKNTFLILLSAMVTFLTFFAVNAEPIAEPLASPNAEPLRNAKDHLLYERKYDKFLLFQLMQRIIKELKG